MDNNFKNWLRDYGGSFFYKVGWLELQGKEIQPGDVFHAAYTSVRICSPKTYASFTDRSSADIATFTSTSSNNINSSPGTSWHIRSVEGNNNYKKPTERISLNVYPTKKLIQDLDTFCLRHKGCFYKTPATLDAWHNRHDSIILSFSEPITPAIEHEIVEITKPYIRGDHLAGHKISTGVYRHKEITRTEIDAIIEEATLLNPDLGECVRKYGYNHPDMRPSWTKDKSTPPMSEPNFSPGDIEAIQSILSSYREFLSRKKYTASETTPSSSAHR